MNNCFKDYNLFSVPRAGLEPAQPLLVKGF